MNCMNIRIAGTLAALGLMLVLSSSASGGQNGPLVFIGNGAVPYAVTEGSASSVTIPVTLDEASPTPVTVDWHTQSAWFPRTASDSGLHVDYAAAGGTVVFAPGERSKTVSVSIVNDGIAEEDESFVVALSNPVGAQIGMPPDFWTHGAVVTIHDNELGVFIGEGGAVFAAPEGDTGTTPFEVSVRLNFASASPVTVDWATRDALVNDPREAATADQDYEAASGTLTFAPGETEKTVTIQIIGDTLSESPEEEFVVSLTHVSGAQVGVPWDDYGLGANVGIQDDDQAPTQGSLTVIMQVVNDDGGTLGASDFTVHVLSDDPTPLTLATFAGAGPPGHAVSLDPGGYQVGVLPKAGYAITSFSSDCAGTIAAGDTKTCTITADDRPTQGSLTVIMQITNSNGGTLGAADFTVSVFTGNDPAPHVTFAGAGAPGHTVSIDPGTYQAGATPQAGYAITSFSSDCSGTIAAGDRKTCTITADDRLRRGTLSVVTQVVNNDGGRLTPADFSFTVQATNPQPGVFSGASAPGRAVTFAPGTYDIVPLSRPTGYNLTFSAGCSGTMGVSDSKSCTITADDIPTRGLLTVILQVINDDGGTLGPSDFTLSIDGGNPSPTSFTGSGPPGQLVSVDPGDYPISARFRVPATGVIYTLSGSSGCFGPIAAGERRTCILTADDREPVDTVRPTVTCGTADGLWHAANVSINCTASDSGSGLANPADAAFSLTTTVPNGGEDANAPTGSRQVCDVAGNCALAGPIAGNKVDRKAPSLSLPANITVDATSPAGALVGWIATASDGADPSPGVNCVGRAGSIFAIGTATVTCTAADHAGNTTSGSFTVTVRGVKEQLSNLIQKVANYSSLPQAARTKLIAALQSLLAGLDPTNATQKQLVCAALNVFIQAVQSMSGRTLPAAVALDWTTDATRIRSVLGC